MSKETFGTILGKLMRERDISQASLSRSVGVHRTTIGDYVHDKYLPTEETFNRIHQVITDKELYDAFFAATKPQDRKNKPLISDTNNTEKTYNFYTATPESIDDVRDFLKDMVANCKNTNIDSGNCEDNECFFKSEEDQTDAPATEKEDNSDKKYIAHALAFVVAYMEENGTMVLAPADYKKYNDLFDKYKKYLDAEAFV